MNSKIHGLIKMLPPPRARPFLDAASRAAILDDVSKFEK
jgi:hypothetical protein